MQQQHVNRIRDATAEAFAAHVTRTLKIMRVRGWVFPENCSVAIRVLDATPLAIVVSARIDDCDRTLTLRPNTTADELGHASEMIIAAWLEKHASERPTKEVP